MVNKVDKRSVSIIAAYTGAMIGTWPDLHEYIEELFGRPVSTHEMASKHFQESLREKSREDFISLEVVG